MPPAVAIKLIVKLWLLRAGIPAAFLWKNRSLLFSCQGLAVVDLQP